MAMKKKKMGMKKMNLVYTMDVEIVLHQNAQNVEVIDISSDDEATAREAAAMRHALHEVATARKHAAHEAAAASKRAAAKWRAAAREARAVAIRGPKIKGRRLTFDECCVFANRVALYGSQVEFLKKVARERPTRHIYVCTIQGAHIDRQRAKMYFARKYNYSFIKKYMDLPTHINVFWHGRDIATMKVIFGKGSNVGVQITSNWKKVMRKTKMKEGEVFLFWFYGCSENGLKLILKRVE